MDRSKTKSGNLLWMAGLVFAGAVLLGGCAEPALFTRIGNFQLFSCSAVIVILDIIALIEVAGSERSTGDKALWAVLIIFAPVIGCILYYFFGRK